MRNRLPKCKLAGRYPRAWLTVCIALGVFTLFIWGNSMRTATQSAQQSESVLTWMTPFLSVLNLQTEGFHTVLRKLAHFSELAYWASCGQLSCGLAPIPRRDGEQSSDWDFVCSQRFWMKPFSYSLLDVVAKFGISGSIPGGPCWESWLYA